MKNEKKPLRPPDKGNTGGAKFEDLNLEGLKKLADQLEPKEKKKTKRLLN